MNNFRVNSDDARTISKEVGRRNSFRNFMEIDGKGNKRRAITWSGRSPAGGGMGARICLFHYGPHFPLRFRYLRSRLAKVRGNLDSAVKLADEYKCQGRLEADLMPLEPGRRLPAKPSISLLAVCLHASYHAEIAGMWSLKGRRGWISRCLVSIVG